MIEYVTSGDILDDDAEALVCPVNCVAGVMGAGLALSFVGRWPWLRQAHRDAASEGRLLPGRVCEARHDRGDRRVIFAATKDHWRSPSRLSWVRGCLFDLEMEPGESTIAMPALGCGLGGLEWRQVEQELPRLLSTPGSARLWRVYSPRGR